MKPLIAFDLDGTIISAKPAHDAHELWFRTMSFLMGTEVSNTDKVDFFNDVFRAMEAYTALDRRDGQSRAVMTKLARNLFQLCTLGECAKLRGTLLIPGMPWLLEKLKKAHPLAVITTTPEDIVRPLLRMVNAEHFFDIIQTQKLDERPSKLKLMKDFIGKHGRPSHYLGNTVEDMQACKDLGIKGVLTTWDTYEDEAKELAHKKVSTVPECEQLLL
jgi:phosphoglycolate phosphatase-like HAD superfamily hydrolase